MSSRAPLILAIYHPPPSITSLEPTLQAMLDTPASSLYGAPTAGEGTEPSAPYTGKHQPLDDPVHGPAGSSLRTPPPKPGLMLDAHVGHNTQETVGNKADLPLPLGPCRQPKIGQGLSRVPGKTGGSWGKPTQESLLIKFPQACPASVSTDPGRSIR